MREADGASAYVAPESLSGAVGSAIRWKAASSVAREGARVATAVTLARVLTPHQWGIAGMAMVIAGFLRSVTDLALGAGLVQKEQITEADRSTMFWISLAFGAAATGVGVAVSGPIAAFFGEPSVRALFIAASFGFTLTALGKVPEALLLRELAFRRLELRKIVGVLTGAVVAIALALAGAGPWAIIANSLTALAVSVALLWAMTPWRPRFTFARATLRAFSKFSATLFGCQLSTYFQLNADNLLVGRFVGASGLGIYSFAYQLMFAPIVNVAYPLHEVLFPVFATIQRDEERLRAAFLRAKRVTVAVMAPVFATTLVVAPDLVPTVFGSKWERAVPVVRLLCLAGIAYSLGTQNWNLLMVRKKLGALLGLTVLVGVVVVSGFAVGLHWGVVGVAAAYALAEWILVIPENAITARAGSIPFARTLGDACVSLPFVAAASGCALAARRGLVWADVPAGGRIVIIAGVLLALYVASAWFGSESLRLELRGVLGRVRRRAADPAARAASAGETSA